MNKINYILTVLLVTGIASSKAQPKNTMVQTQLADTLNIGFQINTSQKTMSYSINGVNATAFENAPFIDINKSLYGKIAGLNVYQGVGSSADNISSLSIHGHSPLILIDGFPRDISDVTSLEIESVYILKDAASTALYGMKGANGVVMVTTKRGKSNQLKINTSYHMGVNTKFRSPSFANSYIYGQALNIALQGDGLASQQYNPLELEAFRTGMYPYEYPNVDWQSTALNDKAYQHNLKMTFNGGNDKFRYFTAVDYYRDESLLKSSDKDNRYDTTPRDTRLSLRTNLDVDITNSTSMKVGILGKLGEINGTRFGRNNIFNVIYSTPSSAFPIMHEDGIYGGGSTYGANNPVALLQDYGHIRNIAGTLMADLNIKQNLDLITQGLSAELLAAFDNIGGMVESSSKTYRYKSISANILEDATLVTTPTLFGLDSETLGHNQGFERLLMRGNLQGKLAYQNQFGKHQISSALVYNMQSVVRNGRNNSFKNQGLLFNPSYTYNGLYTINAVLNYSGSSYLPENQKYDLYPALSAAWVISNEHFMQGLSSSISNLKLRSSYGFSGWDGNLSHELWRQSYGGSGTSYFFGSNGTQVFGTAEGSLPVVGLVAEKSEKATLGIDFGFFGNKLTGSLEGFYEKRSDILVTGNTATSAIIGIGVGQINAGINKYQGFDFALSWGSKINDFHYNIGTNMSYINSEVINDNQAFQQYEYLYRKGNRAGQMYGLEALGFFNSQQEINNSPIQTFSTLSPGDVKYKDQNGDNRIDENDVVRMFGSSLPRFYFGLNLGMSYKNFDINADLQGLTGKTISLLNSPLYKPLINGGNLSNTFLENEVYWTQDNAQQATMPRLTTLENNNNYQASSLWYRDGSFVKLRNLSLAYTYPKSNNRFADLTLYVLATNLFSLDNIGFADPEQLGVAYPSIRSYQLGVKLNF